MVLVGMKVHPAEGVLLGNGWGGGKKKREDSGGNSRRESDPHEFRYIRQRRGGLDGMRRMHPPPGGLKMMRQDNLS